MFHTERDIYSSLEVLADNGHRYFIHYSEVSLEHLLGEDCLDVV